MKSIILAFVIGVSGALCACQGTKRSANRTKKTVKNQGNRCDRGRTKVQRRKEDAAIKSFIAAKCSRAQHQRRGKGQEGTADRSNRDQISQDETYAIALQNELNQERASNQEQISQDEAYVRELQYREWLYQLCQEPPAFGEPNPAAGRWDENSSDEDSSDSFQDEPELPQQPGRSEAPVVGRSNSDQISQDEAYALELQYGLDQERASGRSNSDQISQNESELLPQWDEDSFDLPQDEAYPAELLQQPDGEREGNAPVAEEHREPASVECSIQDDTYHRGFFGRGTSCTSRQSCGGQNLGCPRRNLGCSRR